VDEVTFGRYRLVELLGRGGMGEVWRTYDTVTDRVVAIKLLPANLSEDEDFQRRFRREAHAAARLDSPHVVPIYDHGEIDGRLFVSMRLIAGRDLDTVLADGPLEPARAVRIIDHVAKALHAAHKVGLLHRDIKPSNILLDDDDFAYLIDFGIARVADETRMTKSGHMIGTFQYIAPERLGSRAEEDARADIYSLACVLYECLTGHPPFDEATMARLVAAHLHTPPPKPSTTQPNVPAQIDPVIATGMAKDPDQRYATTVELANAAEDAITIALAPPSEPTLLGDARPSTPAPAAQQRRGDVNLAATQQRPPGRRPVPQPRPVDRPLPDTRTPPQRRWWRRKVIVIPAVCLAMVGIAVAAVILNPSDPQITPSSSQITSSTSTQHHGHTYDAQVTQTFIGLNEPTGITVDTAGNLYVADPFNDRVLKLTADPETSIVLPFTGLHYPARVAVDTAGNFYIVDGAFDQRRVVKFTAGSETPTVLPFTGLGNELNMAVDSAGNLYISDMDHPRVLKLAAGSDTPTVLPFTDLQYPQGVAVDSAGNVYVVDATNSSRVLKLAAGSDTPTVLPFTGLRSSMGVAVDAARDVYVADEFNHRVLKLAAGSGTPTVLPFTGLYLPTHVAVDTTGNVYVIDEVAKSDEVGAARVLKLAVQ
jgi:serine/threonine-protein kinase